jgi:hypothetical protein
LVWTRGFEYTFTEILDSVMNFGVVGEWMFDKREERTTTAVDNDIAKIATGSQ